MVIFADNKVHQEKHGKNQEDISGVGHDVCIVCSACGEHIVASGGSEECVGEFGIGQCVD